MAFFEAAYAASDRPTRLIDADPDLFNGVDDSKAHGAVYGLTVAVVRVPAGPWPVTRDGEDARLGLLVLEGLLALFGHFGDRWGRVTPAGIHVPVLLTHDRIAQLVGAQRPTVTTALNDLHRRGRLVKRPDRTWLIAASNHS
jgi:hypothetical protein